MKIKFIALVMVVAMSLMPLTALAGEKESITYTAMGDSIAFGVGGETVSLTDLSGYTDMLDGHLKTIYGEDNVQFNDWGGPNGGTSEYIRNILKAAYLSKNGMYDQLKESHIITLSIGGNDILAAAAGSGLTISSTSISPEQQAALHSAVMQFGNNLTAFTADISNADGMGVMQLLRLINPTAEIYVNTVYNPFIGSDLEEVTDVIFEGYGMMPGVNSIIRNSAAALNYEYIEVYGEFSQYNNTNKPLVHDAESDFVYHPTTRGYKMIYNLIKDMME